MSVSVERIKNTLIYIKQTVITTSIPFLVLLVVARYVTPEDFGFYALSQVYAIVLTGLFSFGLHIGYERNYFKYSGDVNSLGALHNSVLGFVTLSYSLVAVLSLVFIEQVSDLVGVQRYDLLFVVLLGQAFNRLAQFYLIYYKNSENARRYSFHMIAATIINAVISILLVVMFDMGVMGVALGYALSWFLVMFFMFVGVLNEIALRLDWKFLKEALIISLPVTPRTLIVIMGAQSDKYILGLLGTVGGVGLYNIAYRVSSVINSYMIALQNAYTPSLYKLMFSGESTTGKGMGRYLTLITYFSILPAVMVAVFANEIVWLLLPDTYAAAGDILVVLAVYYGVIFFGKISGVQLIYAKKTGLTTLLSIVFAALNIALNIPLINYYGVLGAAFATLLTGSLYTLASYFVAQKYCHIEWEGGRISGIVFTLLLSGLIVLLLAVFSESYATMLATKTLLALFYGYLGFRFGLLSRVNLNKLLSGLKGK